MGTGEGIPLPSRLGGLGERRPKLILVHFEVDAYGLSNKFVPMCRLDPLPPATRRHFNHWPLPHSKPPGFATMG